MRCGLIGRGLRNQAKGAEAGLSVPAVFFPRVPHGADDNDVTDDLEQNDVARCTEGHDQFSRAYVFTGYRQTTLDTQVPSVARVT